MNNKTELGLKMLFILLVVVVMTVGLTIYLNNFK